MKKIKSILAALMIIGIFAACGPNADDPIFYKIRVESFTVEADGLNEGTVSLCVGNTLQLVITVTPADAYEKTMIFLVDNDKVATVTPEGLIEAIGTGSANVTIYSTDKPEISQSFTLNVVDNKVEFAKDDKVDQGEAEARQR